MLFLAALLAGGPFLLDPRADDPAARARRADAALAAPLVLIVDKPAPSPTGDARDYVSYARYWWPDPKSRDGLPFVRHDGHANLAQVRLGDEGRLGTMQDAVRDLALGWAATRRREYADRAAVWLKAWFVAPATRMSPNLEYAQVQLGRHHDHGNPTGILDARKFAETVDALRLLRDSGAIAPPDQAAIDGWFRTYLEWMLHSENGRAEHAARNNHGSWFLAQAAAIALYVGDEAAARGLCEEDRARIGWQIRPDGSQPEELSREDGLTYSAFNLQAQFELARLAQGVGVDLAHFRAPGGGSLQAALDFLRPYDQAPERWPGKQLNRPKRGFLRAVLADAARAGVK
ncbi:MAG TPA: alginate lyase family protein [Opitutaceae bacterium]|nr:alginate lyase family protein [Opitutaceae bacterium]